MQAKIKKELFGTIEPYLGVGISVILSHNKYLVLPILNIMRNSNT